MGGEPSLLRLISPFKELRFLQLTVYILILLIISPLLSGSPIINVLALLVSLAIMHRKEKPKNYQD